MAACPIPNHKQQGFCLIGSYIPLNQRFVYEFIHILWALILPRQNAKPSNFSEEGMA